METSAHTGFTFIRRVSSDPLRNRHAKGVSFSCLNHIRGDLNFKFNLPAAGWKPVRTPVLLFPIRFGGSAAASIRSTALHWKKCRLLSCPIQEGHDLASCAGFRRAERGRARTVGHARTGGPLDRVEIECACRNLVEAAFRLSVLRARAAVPGFHVEFDRVVVLYPLQLQAGGRAGQGSGLGNIAVRYDGIGVVVPPVQLISAHRAAARARHLLSVGAGHDNLRVGRRQGEFQDDRIASLLCRLSSCSPEAAGQSASADNSGTPQSHRSYRQ